MSPEKLTNSSAPGSPSSRSDSRRNSSFARDSDRIVRSIISTALGPSSSASAVAAIAELSWMADLGLRHLETDATAGLLTAAAAQNILPADNLFDSPVTEAINQNAQALIAEEVVRCDLSRL